MGSMDYTNKRVLVTGGAGYIGCHTCLCLLEQGYDVVVFDNFFNSGKEGLRRVQELTKKSVTFELIDVANPQELDEGFKKHGPFSAVLHFASLKAVGESVEKPLLYYNNNLNCAIVLLQAMEKYDCQRLIFSSSATVYGDPEFLPLTESAKLGCTNPYGRTKLMIEQILQDYCIVSKKLVVTVLRYFNPVGAHKSGRIGEDPSGIPNNLMPYLSQVASGKLEYLSIFGNDWPSPDGTGVRDFIHVMDLAEGHVSSLKAVAKPGVKTYNLGTGKGISVLEILSAMEKATGRSLPFKYGPRRKGDIGICYADASLAERELNWRATRSLKDMCEDSWRWQQQNPHGYKVVPESVPDSNL